MQVDRLFEGANDAQQEQIHSARPVRVPARASVWIDPVEQRNVSTEYVERGQEGQRRRKKVISHPITPTPSTPHAALIPSTPVPARSSAYPPNSLSVRQRAPRTYVLPAPEQEEPVDVADLTDMPTVPPVEERQAKHASSLHFGTGTPVRSRLHAKSTASRPKNASLSPQRAIDELDTLPPILPTTPVPSVASIEQAIDEIDTILPVSPSIDEIDTLPLPLKLSRTSGASDAHHRASLRKNENEVDIDEIDTLAPGTVTVLSPEPDMSPSEPARKQVIIVDSRPPVSMQTVAHSGQVGRVGHNVSWTTGVGANSEFAKMVASRAQAKQGKPLGELVLTPLSDMRWWLLYPGRMEFMLWISGALILLGVTCTLLFATLASTGLIRVATTGAVTGVHHEVNKNVACSGSTSHCHSAGKVTTVVSSTTNKQHSSSKPMQATSVAGTVPVTSKKPGSSGTPGVPVGGSVGTSTPVSQTPVAPSPTVSISPTIEPTHTTPTPTPTKTVTPSPTVAITPTIGATPPGKKPTTTTSAHADSQTLALGNAFDSASSSQNMGIWWLVLVGYAFSMLMLGLAALLYRRKRRVS